MAAREDGDEQLLDDLLLPDDELGHLRRDPLVSLREPTGKLRILRVSSRWALRSRCPGSRGKRGWRRRQRPRRENVGSGGGNLGLGHERKLATSRTPKLRACQRLLDAEVLFAERALEGDVHR